MSNFVKMAVLSGAICALLGAGPAAAIDDRFNPHKYEKGGFAPASNPTYVNECGACHFVYLPGLLPARSWRAIMAKANNDHFGESLSLSPDVAREIEQYLASNAADRSNYRGASAILYRLSDSATPSRITALPVMRQRHAVVRKLMAERQELVHSLTNCNACHEKAVTGSFAYEEIVVPGVTKVVRPGGMF
jgi:Dihaem cytochrome c